eukprot:TRINITY_DN3131_c0_g1_i4.p2 TRINITY_DN3131_c0_g1~~TRINITY_DN3131_c0_g1_i4.p2  ORF type:complete len:265 (-),score=36.66 TRINITY_DN3131_c0_g1_i4:901-1695(-)
MSKILLFLISLSLFQFLCLSVNHKTHAVQPSETLKHNASKWSFSFSHYEAGNTEHFVQPEQVVASENATEVFVAGSFSGSFSLRTNEVLFESKEQSEEAFLLKLTAEGKESWLVHAFGDDLRTSFKKIVVRNAHVFAFMSVEKVADDDDDDDAEDSKSEMSGVLEFIINNPEKKGKKLKDTTKIDSNCILLVVFDADNAKIKGKTILADFTQDVHLSVVKFSEGESKELANLLVAGSSPERLFHSLSLTPKVLKEPRHLSSSRF